MITSISKDDEYDEDANHEKILLNELKMKGAKKYHSVRGNLT